MLFKKSLPLFALFFIEFIFAGCTSNEIGESKDVAQDKIYQQYTVTYAEGNEKITVHAQFRFAGRNGTTLVLSKPSQLSFDDEAMPVDSGSVSGAYYQLYKPVSRFYGKHHFVFSDINNKKFDNDFSFDTFKLVNIPPTVVKTRPFDLSFETAPLNTDDYIELSTNGTDSSFTITHNAGDTGRFITIPEKELKRQKEKELTLEARLYRKIPLQQNTAEGGRLEIRYTLKPVKIRLAE